LTLRVGDRGWSAARARRESFSFTLVTRPAWRRTFFVPVVAFLSYSTKGSAAGPKVEKVKEAARLFAERHPEIRSDGEMQGDAALVAEVGTRKAPGSPVAGYDWRHAFARGAACDERGAVPQSQ
jgi:hypothetical protein